MVLTGFLKIIKSISIIYIPVDVNNLEEFYIVLSPTRLFTSEKSQK